MWLSYPHSMVKVQAVYPAFRRWLHDWGILLVIPLGFQERKPQPFPMGRVVMLHAII